MELVVISKKEHKELEKLQKLLKILGYSNEEIDKTTKSLYQLTTEFTVYKEKNDSIIKDLQEQVATLQKQLKETQEELIRFTSEQTNNMSEWAKKAYEEMMGNPVIIKGNDVKLKDDGGIV